MNKKTAFSLIELSIVLIIIALLVIGVVAGNSLVKSAKKSKARSLTQSSPVIGIEGLELWLESTQKDNFKADQAIEGTTIDTWYDRNHQSGKKSHPVLFHPTIEPPTYLSEGINELPTIKFYNSSPFGAAGAYFEADINDISDEVTIFMVTKISSFNNNNYFFPYGLLSDTANHSDHSHANLFANTPSHVKEGNTYINISMNSINQKDIIHTTRYTKTNGEVYLNGSSLGSFAESGIKIAKIIIGARFYSAFYRDQFTGEIGELIIYNRALSDKEIEYVHDYLQKKWKIK